jgi:hypothetical protein
VPFQLLIVCLLPAGMPDAVFLEHSAEVTALPDSGYIELTREVIVPLTGRGVERYSTMSITHRDGWETVEVIEARTGHWRAGRGSCSADIREIPHHSLVSDGRLEATLRETLVSFRGVERGDTLVLEVARRIDFLPVADFYCYSFYSGGRDSVDSASFTVTWPDGRPLYTSESPGFTSGCRETSEDGAVVLRWTCGPEPASPDHFLAPGPGETAPCVTVAGSTPEEVSRGFMEELDVMPSGDADSVADSVLSSAGMDPEALRRWVSSHIEYIGSDWGEYPGFTPRSPLETLAYRSGVCRDNALLLAWLLRKAGWRADLVLTSTSGIAGDLAGSRSFDHMLVRVGERPDYRFLDPTSEPSGSGLAGSYRGLRYLALTDPGSGMEVFPDPVSGDTLLVQVTGSLDLPTGCIQGHVELRLTGAAADLYASMLTRTLPDRRQELLDVLTGARPGSGRWAVPDPSAVTGPLVMTGDCTWEVTVLEVPGGTAACLPGLQETSLTGTRTAALLLPEEPTGGIRLATPVHEVLDMTLYGFPGHPDTPAPDSAGCWRRTVSCTSGDTLLVHEECTMEPALPDSARIVSIIEGLAARCREPGRAVLFR